MGANDSANIYPLHCLDIWRKPISFVLLFNDVLDAEQLHQALTDLLKIGDWKKLSGRLEYASGKLQLRVPKAFDADCPVIGFSHNTKFQEALIEEHSSGRTIPDTTDNFRVQFISSDSRDLALPSEFPTDLDDAIARATPQISLHVTSFRNATIVSLSWFHILMDALGCKELLNAWSLVLAGRTKDVPTVLGAKDDLLYDLFRRNKSRAQEELIIESKRRHEFLVPDNPSDITGSDPLYYGTLSIPDDSAEYMLLRARSEVMEVNQWESKDPPYSKEDVLLAWLVQSILRASNNSQSATIGTFQDLRSRLKKVLRKGCYLQNMVLMNFTFLSESEEQRSIGSIASQHRHQCNLQSTVSQTLSFLRTILGDIEQGRMPQLSFGPAHATYISYNNIAPVCVDQVVNFEAAVLQSCDLHKRKNKSGSAILHYHLGITGHVGPANTLFYLGQNHNRDHVLMAVLKKETWEFIQSEALNLEKASKVSHNCKL